MFKRRRSAEDESAEDVSGDVVDRDEDLDDEESDEDVQDLDDDEEDGAAPASGPRQGGPFDVSEIDDDLERLDLGALRVVPTDDVEVRLEVDEQTAAVQAMTLATVDSAMQVGAFAAPRSEGIWDEVRTDIAASITDAGGTVDAGEGEFGPELRTVMHAHDDQGRHMTQSLLFVGVDGPRWFLRGVVSGAGVSDPAALAPLIESFRTIVVVRGDEPLAPHEQLPLHLPREATEVDENPEAAGHDLNPFRRGPEITEIR